MLISNLQVVGVMGQAMQAVSPSLISSILRCAKKAEVPLSHQKAAIQAFRRMDVSDEVKSLSYMDTSLTQTDLGMIETVQK